MQNKNILLRISNIQAQKILLRTLGITLLILFFISCENDGIVSSNNSVLQKTGVLNFNINMTTAPSDVVSLNGYLVRTGYDTIRFEFTMYSDSAVALVEDLATGTWYLHVDVSNSEGIIIYTGSTSVTVQSGVITPVSLHMDPTTGGISITVIWDDDINTGLVAYYSFNGDANDESGNGYDGTVIGATLSTDRNGNTNCAYSFTDSSYINIGRPDGLEITGALTLCAWVYYNAFDSYSGIISKGLMYNGHQYQGAYGIGVNYLNQRIYFDLRTNESVRRTALSDSVLSVNTWYHIAGTFTPGVGLKVYLNGTMVGSSDFTDTEISHTTSWNNNDIRIGDSQQSQINPSRFPGFLNGIIDEVRIYNRALSQSEIIEVMSAN